MTIGISNGNAFSWHDRLVHTSAQALPTFFSFTHIHHIPAQYPVKIFNRQ